MYSAHVLELSADSGFALIQNTGSIETLSSWYKHCAEYRGSMQHGVAGICINRRW